MTSMEHLWGHRNPHFLLRSQKEGFRGAIVEVLSPGVHYLCIYWPWGLIRGREVVRGGVNIAR